MPTKKQNTEWADLVGNRVIARNSDPDDYRYGKEFEFRVEEVSPGGRVKFRAQSGLCFWAHQDDMELVEDLGGAAR